MKNSSNLRIKIMELQRNLAKIILKLLKNHQNRLKFMECYKKNSNLNKMS